MSRSKRWLEARRSFSICVLSCAICLTASHSFDSSFVSVPELWEWLQKLTIRSRPCISILYLKRGALCVCMCVCVRAHMHPAASAPITMIFFHLSSGSAHRACTWILKKKKQNVKVLHKDVHFTPTQKHSRHFQMKGTVAVPQATHCCKWIVCCAQRFICTSK